MARSTRTRNKPEKSEQMFGKLLAGATLTLILLYFIQSAVLIAEKKPFDTAIANYKQQVQLESKAP